MFYYINVFNIHSLIIIIHGHTCLPDLLNIIIYDFYIIYFEFQNKLADPIKETINRNLKSRNTKYSPALRSFALTLQFYSSKAYLFVRKTFKNLLPHPNTLKKWYSVIDGEPGFTKEAFQSITKRVSESADPVICNIVIDEMSIRKQITYLNGKFYGGVDLGTTQEQVDNIHEATNALVFLAVCINGHWKVPLGYFLINSFSGSERANLLKKCLEIFFETGAKCYSITFDGAPCNISMCKILGANFDYFSSEFKPWISVPEIPGSKNEKIIYIFWDAVHMLKLVRNTLGEKKVIINPVGEQIKWHHIEMLQSIQETKGLHAANKLKKNHINYFENKMSVKLAVQTLSSSVSSSLLFCERLNLIPNAKPTAHFCKIFNDVFDVCNCRNKLAKGDYSFPVNEKNLQRIIDLLDQFKSYVEGLKYQKNLDTDEELLLKSQRKTGFLGLIICLENLINVYRAVEKDGMSFLLSYKLSQDHLEVFFSALRSRGGFNNNPNAVQFRTAYKRLLVRHEISGSMYGNCTQLDTSCILFVGANKRKDANAICNNDTLNNEEENNIFSNIDHDYDYRMPSLEDYIIDVVKYTSGFILRKIR